MNKEVLVVDKTGTVFENGVTNFNAESLHACMQEIGNPKENVTLRIHEKVFDRLSYYNLMTPGDKEYDFENGAVFEFQDIPITAIDHGNNRGSIFQSRVYVDGKLRAVLKTREY